MDDLNQQVVETIVHLSCTPSCVNRERKGVFGPVDRIACSGPDLSFTEVEQTVFKAQSRVVCITCRTLREGEGGGKGNFEV